MQTLVIAHAAFGHNQLLQERLAVPAVTAAEAFSIISISPRAIAQGEERYRPRRGRATLDAAHVADSARHRIAIPARRISILRSEEKRAGSAAPQIGAFTILAETIRPGRSEERGIAQTIDCGANWRLAA